MYVNHAHHSADAGLSGGARPTRVGMPLPYGPHQSTRSVRERDPRADGCAAWVQVLRGNLIGATRLQRERVDQMRPEDTPSTSLMRYPQRPARSPLSRRSVKSASWPPGGGGRTA